MNALHVAWKDLQINIRDRGWLIELFILPLVFITVVSGALPALMGGNDTDDRIELPVVNLDGGPAAQRLLEGIDAAGGVRVVLYDEAEASRLLDERQIAAVLTVPPELSDALAARGQATLRLTNHPDADPKRVEAARLVVEGVVQDLLLEHQIIASLEHLAAMQALSPEVTEALGTERIIAQAEAQFAQAQARPLVTLSERPPAVADVEQRGFPDAIQLAVPGFAVLFVFLTSQATAGAIFEEKRTGSFKRMLATPISRSALLAGKMLPTFITGLVQTGVIFGFGLFVLPLMGLAPVSLGNAPGALLLVVLAMTLCSTALGLFIAALARTQNQIGGLSTLILWGAGILGGSFVPLFLLERYLGTISRFVPHYWANRAFESLLVRGQGFAAVQNEILWLLVFAAIFTIVGLRRFRFDEVAT